MCPLTAELGQLEVLAGELDRTHPGAAGSLREGMAETLTVTRLGIRGKLRRTLESTNACESMIEIIRRTQRNVKHWSSGEMGLRWTAAGMLEAEQQFRKIIGHTDLAKLAVAIERDLARRRQAVTPAPARRRYSQKRKVQHCRPCVASLGVSGAWRCEINIRRPEFAPGRTWTKSAMTPPGFRPSLRPNGPAWCLRTVERGDCAAVPAAHAVVPIECLGRHR
jgi:hypothetical protein